MKGFWDWAIAIGVTAGVGLWIVKAARVANAMPSTTVTPDGFAVSGTWIDAGVWLANRFNRDKVSPTQTEYQFIQTTFTSLGVDETGIIRYRPNPAVVSQVLFTSDVSQKVQQIVLDFINACEKLPARVLA